MGNERARNEGSACKICGWDDGDNHDPVPHLLEEAKGFGAQATGAQLVRAVVAYRKGISDLTAICADIATPAKKRLERIDVSLMALGRHVREAVAGKSSKKKAKEE